MFINKLNLLLTNEYSINDKLVIRLPKLGNILDYDEEKYFKMVSALISIPSDMKSSLWDKGIDYEEISDLELFFYLTRGLTPNDTSILLGDNIDLSTMQLYHNSHTDLLMICESSTFYEELNKVDRDGARTLVSDVFKNVGDKELALLKFLVDQYKCEIMLAPEFETNLGDLLYMPIPKKDGLVIDTNIHGLLNDCIREMHGFKDRKSSVEKAGTKGTKEMLIMADRDDRAKAERMYKIYGYQSSIEPLLVALVNTNEFPYNYKTVQDISYYAFMQSAKQIQRYKSYFFTMHGVVTGNIDAKKLKGKNRHALEWIPSTKNN